MQFLDDFVGRVLPCNADFHAFFGILTYLSAMVQNLGFDITILNDISYFYPGHLCILSFEITCAPYLHPSATYKINSSKFVYHNTRHCIFVR